MRHVPRIAAAVGLSTATLLAITACSNGGASGGASEGQRTLTFASSQSTSHPNYWCGLELFAEQVQDAEVGLNVDTFPGSQLGPDTERIRSVAAGDLDIDLSAPSGVSNLFPKAGVVDSAYAFEDIYDYISWADSPAGQALFDEIYDEIGVKVLTIWYYGDFDIAANEPIRTPEDLAGVPIRVPDSPMFLLNAEAIGVSPVPVAFEEIYTALQQRIVSGTVSPITALTADSLDEVVSHVNVTGHQVYSHYLTISGDTWEGLSSEQQDAVLAAAVDTRDANVQCMEEEDQKIIEDWTASGSVTVIDDVDVEAFRAKAEAFFSNHYSGEELELYESMINN